MATLNSGGLRCHEVDFTIAKQYSDFKVDGKKIDGKQTLNENIADNGRLKLAFKPWSCLYKEKAALRQLEIDCHSFPKYRINDPLQNFAKFAEAFHCKPGTPINPENKCSLW